VDYRDSHGYPPIRVGDVDHRGQVLLRDTKNRSDCKLLLSRQALEIAKRNCALKAPQPHRKRVWRISQLAPMGEWVDLARDAERVPPPELPEVNSGGWVVSSLDLLHGTDIIEDGEADTIPGELLDQLFASRYKGPKDPSK
jgi:hypothetical protein